MKVYTQSAMAVAVVAAMCCVQAQAQDYYASAYNPADAYVASTASLENDMATLRGNLGGGEDGAGCCDTGCCDAGCCGAGCCDPCCGDCGCNDSCPAVQFWVDATFLRFHKTGGVRVGNDAGEDAELGYFISPRFNLRFYNSNDMYWQISYFEFNHGTLLTVGDPGSHIGVRSWTLDAVAGERFMLNRDWVIDWNGGARLYNYSETATDANEAEFNFDHSWGIGGILGIEGSRSIGNGLSVYGGAKLGIIHGDHTVIFRRDNVTVNRRLLDENFIHTELGTGVEYSTYTASGVEVIAKVGAEFITYENASSAFALAPGEVARGPGADVGYGGFTFSLGIYR